MSGRILVQAAARSMAHLHTIVTDVGHYPGVRDVTHSLYAEVFKRTTVTYRSGALPSPDATR